MERIGDLRSKPALRTLALRGVAYDEPAKRLFHTEGRAALQVLAKALALGSGSFDVRSNKAGPAVSGEVTLHAEMLWAQLSLGPFGPRSEENTSELQSLMRISYAVFSMKKKKHEVRNYTKT